MVGDLTVEHGARRKLAVSDVLQGEAPRASRGLHGLYRRDLCRARPPAF
jgi:hypothetical protein